MKRVSLFTVLVLAAIGAMPSRAADTALMRTLQARINAFTHAVNTDNVAGIKGHIPDTAIFQLSDHHVLTAAEFLKTVANTEKTLKGLKMAATLKSAHKTSNGAWGNMTVVTTGRHQDSRGRWHRLETTERVLVSWKRTPAGYSLERITQVGYVQKVDGRVVAEADRT